MTNLLILNRYKRQTYLDSMRDLLQLQYVMTRLYEKAVGGAMALYDKVRRDTLRRFRVMMMFSTLVWSCKRLFVGAKDLLAFYTL